MRGFRKNAWSWLLADSAISNHTNGAAPKRFQRKAPPVRAGLSCRAAGYHMPLGVGCARGQHHQKRRHPLAGLSCGSYKSNTAIPMIMGTAEAPFLYVYVRDPEGNVVELEQR